MKKNQLVLFVLIVFVSITITAQKELDVVLDSSTKVTPDGEGGLYFAGTKDVNYRFSQRITPHGDCIDVVNGYAFITWYKGGMDTRNLMLSRKNLNIPNSPWVTIQFPHKHVGQGGELLNGTGIRGDSHNTAAIGVSTIDDTIHIIYDMHAYSSASLPNDFFNYSVSLKNKAFVPDNEFTLAIFNYLKSGGDYERMTYPMIHRADDGSLIARYRQGGSGNGDILLAHYDGSVWSNNWLFHEGTLALPNRNNMYGGERFLNGKFYSGFSIRYSTNNDANTSNGYLLNSGLYYAYTNGIPANAYTPWFDSFS
ncbi:BNR-4 repeat-containing protein [Geojedonia litorea]|uniref:BNR-4 repeat-containing protein n=1 Tax=Geojedonia litorea TaxID=1268269 RepID=A0ABV9N765_9FLAO